MLVNQERKQPSYRCQLVAGDRSRFAMRDSASPIVFVSFSIQIDQRIAVVVAILCAYRMIKKATATKTKMANPVRMAPIIT